MTSSTTIRRTAPAAVAALLSLGLLAGCGSNEKEATDPSTTGTPTSASTTTQTSSAAATESSTAAGSTDVTLYWGVDTPMNLRLAGESTAVSGEPVQGALQALLAGDPTDPDYAALVPKDSLTSASVVPGKEITLEVANPAYADASEDTAPGGNKLAIQQLIYSLNSANGTADKPLPVHFTLGGQDSTYLGQPTRAKAAPQLRVLSMMSVLSPADGSTLSGRTVFSGVGSSFEGTVAWEVRDSSDKVVLRGSSQSDGWMDKLYPWKATLDLSKLAPGSYTFVAMTDDPSGGEGGGPFKDDKTFTIS
ncbi:Gmad2 immunoglobulin-like domain-containing protein [Nocardioides montaniterrae]